MVILHNLTLLMRATPMLKDSSLIYQIQPPGLLSSRLWIHYQKTCLLCWLLLPIWYNCHSGEGTVNKVKDVDILGTIYHVNFVSYCLAKKIKMGPKLNYLVVYGTAGHVSTKSIGAYSAHPLQFRKLVLMARPYCSKNKTTN